MAQQITTLRKTQERLDLYQQVRKVYPYLPENMTSRAIDRMMLLLLQNKKES